MLCDVERYRSLSCLNRCDLLLCMRAAIADKIRLEPAFFAKHIDPLPIMVRQIEVGRCFAFVVCSVGSDHGKLVVVEELVHIH